MSHHPSRRVVLGVAQVAALLWSGRALAQFGGGNLLGSVMGQGNPAGLKDLLRVSSRNVVGQLGKPNGFLDDPAVRIPLPGPLQQMQQPLSMVGASGMLDDLTTRMNHGAEQGVSKAGPILGKAITNMSFDDARGILSGPQDSVTQYFQRSCSGDLTTAFTPVMGSALKGSGAMRVMDSVRQKANGLPNMGMLAQMAGNSGFGGGMMSSLANLDLVGFATGAALSGVFHYMGQQEADIRSNPGARSTDALRSLFR